MLAFAADTLVRRARLTRTVRQENGERILATGEGDRALAAARIAARSLRAIGVADARGVTRAGDRITSVRVAGRRGARRASSGSVAGRSRGRHVTAATRALAFGRARRKAALIRLSVARSLTRRRPGAGQAGRHGSADDRAANADLAGETAGLALTAAGRVAAHAVGAIARHALAEHAARRPVRSLGLAHAAFTTVRWLAIVVRDAWKRARPVFALVRRTRQARRRGLVVTGAGAGADLPLRALNHALVGLRRERLARRALRVERASTSAVAGSGLATARHRIGGAIVVWIEAAESRTTRAACRERLLEPRGARAADPRTGRAAAHQVHAEGGITL